METVKIIYEEFLKIKASRYSYDVIKQYACKYLNCKLEEIDDIDWNFKRTFYVWLNKPEKELVDDSLPF